MLFLFALSCNLFAQNAGLYRSLDEDSIIRNHRNNENLMPAKADYVDVLLSREDFSNAMKVLNTYPPDADETVKARCLLQVTRVLLKENKLEKARYFLDRYADDFSKKNYRDLAGIPLNTPAEILNGVYHVNRGHTVEAARTFGAVLNQYPTDGDQENVFVRASVLVEMIRMFALYDDAPMLETTCNELTALLPLIGDRKATSLIRFDAGRWRALSAVLAHDYEKIKEYAGQLKQIQAEAQVTEASWGMRKTGMELYDIYISYISGDYAACRKGIVPLMFNLTADDSSTDYMYEELLFARILASAIFLKLGYHNFATAYTGQFISDFQAMDKKKGCFVNESVFMYQAISSIFAEMKDRDALRIYCRFQDNYFKAAGRFRTNYATEQHKKLNENERLLSNDKNLGSPLNIELSKLSGQSKKIREQIHEIEKLAGNGAYDDAMPLIHETFDLYHDYLYHNYTSGEDLNYFFNFCDVSITLAQKASTDELAFFARVLTDGFLSYARHLLQMTNQQSDKFNWSDYDNRRIPYLLYSKEVDDEHLASTMEQYLSLCITIADVLKKGDNELLLTTMNVGFAVAQQLYAYDRDAKNRRSFSKFLSDGLRIFSEAGLKNSEAFTKWSNQLRKL